MLRFLDEFLREEGGGVLLEFIGFAGGPPEEDSRLHRNTIAAKHLYHIDNDPTSVDGTLETHVYREVVRKINM